MRTLAGRRLSTRILGGFTYRVAVLQDQPAHYWRFEEDISTVADQVGNSDITLVNGPARVGGAVGFAAGFNGVDQRGTIPVGIPAQPFPLTIEMWVKTTESSQRGLLGVIDAVGSTSLLIILNQNANGSPESDAINFFIRNAASGSAFTRWSITEPDVFDGDWHHLVFVVADARNAAAIATYVDGSPVVQTVQQDNFAGVSWSPGSVVWVADTNGFAVGPAAVAVDELAIYYSALSASRIDAHYLTAVTE